MSKALGEIRVEERDGCVALLCRTTNRRPWDAWTIVETEGSAQEHGWEDPTYGSPGFRAIRPLERFYVNDIGYYARKVGTYRKEERARAKAIKALDKFLRWRDEQKRIESEMEAVET